MNNFPPFPELSKEGLDAGVSQLVNAFELLKSGNAKSIKIGGFTITGEMEFIDGEWVTTKQETIIDNTVVVEYF